MEIETKEIEYLRAARGAMISGKLDDALLCYRMALSENPENPEAKYFCRYNDFEEGLKKGEVKNPFIYLITSLQGAVEYVAKFDCSNYEKCVVINAIVASYKNIPEYIILAYEHLSIDLIEECILSCYWLGTYITENFQGNQEFEKYAIEPWEKAIELHQLYGVKAENYKVEDYAGKLKILNPDYIIPEKPLENMREKKAREEAEEAEKKAKIEAERAEKKARERAEEAEKRAKIEAEKAEKNAREEAEKAEKLAQAKKEKLKTYSYIALGICVFFLLGALVGVDESTKGTLPVILGISLIAAIVFFVLRFKPELMIMCVAKIKGLQKQKIEKESKEKNDNSKDSNGENDVDCENRQ